MRTKIMTIAAVMLLVCTSANAQGKVRSITVGVAPLGYSHVNISLKDEKYKYDYKSYMNFNVGYERQFKGVVSLTEITYAQAKFDKYDLTGTSQWFDPTQKEDVKDFAITTYAGKTINPNKRIQFPVYIGIGGEYLSGGPLHNLAIDLAAKARVKFYISNNFGIYVGATGRYGYGMKSASKKSSNDYDSTKSYSIVPTMWAVDAGIVIEL